MDKNKMHLVNGESITALVNQGRLGILDLWDMNKALAVKWIFNYTNNKDALWRKVVCAHSKSDLNRLMLALENSGNKSVLLEFVDGALRRTGHVREVINQHFRILNGDGQNTNFWNEDWTHAGQLHQCFPRTFELARCKSGSVKNFKSWLRVTRDGIST